MSVDASRLLVALLLLTESQDRGLWLSAAMYEGTARSLAGRLIGRGV